MNQIKILKHYKHLFSKDLFKLVAIYLAEGRGTGKTRLIIDLIIYFSLTLPNFHSTIVRNTNTNIMKSIYPELLKGIHRWKLEDYVTFKKQEQVFTFKNGNSIWLQGAQPQTTITVPFAGQTIPVGCEYYLAWGEEMWEWNRSWYTSFLQGAGRGAPNKLFIFTSNSWLWSNWYVKMINDWAPFNKKKMRKEGVVETDVITKSGPIKVFQANIWSNYLLPKDDYDAIIQSIIAEPWKEDPALYGMPGNLGHTIYAHLLDKTKWPFANNDQINYQEFRIGLDFGEITDSTSMVIGTLTDKREVLILDEFEIKPRPGLEREEMAHMAYQRILQWKQRYNLNRQVLKVIYDNSAVIFARILNRMNSDLYIQFQPCSKFPIVERIRWTLTAMGQKQLLFNDNIIILKREMEASAWKENRTTGEPIQERVDGNDHMINAFEYMIEDWMFIIENQKESEKLWDYNLYE